MTSKLSVKHFNQPSHDSPTKQMSHRSFDEGVVGVDEIAFRSAPIDSKVMQPKADENVVGEIGWELNGLYLSESNK